MKVHFISSRTSLEKDIDSLRKISNIIKDLGHDLAEEWLEDAYALLVKESSKRSDWTATYKSRLATIAKSDVVIAEATYDSFGVGYQVSAAVQQKKPVLILRHATADSNAFATGVIDDWVLHKTYEENSLTTIIGDFIEANDIKTKDLRFNFFIDRQIYNYLRWASFKTNRTKAEILRDLVLKEINKQEKP